jgi:carboxyl-terminal processing protease
MKFTFKKLAIAAGVFITLSAFTISENDRLFEISKNIEIFVNVFKELNKNYVDEVDPATLMRTGIDAMVESLDPFTNYISESQVERYRISDDESYQGIGASIAIVENKVFLANIMEKGGAFSAGLKAGDELISINGESLKSKSEEEIMIMLRGVGGSPVNLQILKSGTNTSQAITLERSEVNIPNVPYAGMVSDGIGYINLTTFTDNAGANITKELKRLKRELPDSTSLKGIILDLRYNGGGLLREAVNICNIFIPKGEEVVFTRGKLKEKDTSFKTTSLPTDLDIPVAVLVNKRSASASEIVSGVLQDRDRAVIIGQRTYGKGLVQNTFELGYNNRVKITTSKYYIPSGRCIQGVEYKDGEPVDIADAKRSKFKTKNGRTVLDGGGVTPDIKLEAHELAYITKALLDKKLIYQYVNKFIAKSDSIKDINAFNFTAYQEFVDFVKKQNFTYYTDGEKELESLEKKVMAEPSLKSLLSSEIATIKSKINNGKSNDLTKYKDEITTEIEKEIVSRYFYQKGKTQIALKRDKEVDEAIALLKDKKRYTTILGIK